MALEDAKTQVDQAFTRDDPRGLSFENAFGGATSFLRRRYSKDLAGVDVAVTGIPFDQAVTHRPGARFGPRAIREASTLQPYDPPYGWGYDPLSLLHVVDYGDMAFDYANTREVPFRIEAHLGAILDAGAMPLVLGGDHFVTLPILRAIAARRGPVALIQFDAHSDTWVDDDPDRIDHGTFLYKAIREGAVDPSASVSIGIRTENPDTMGVTILDAPSVHQDGIAATLAVLYAFWRARTDRRWALATGVLWGVALLTKLNAFFMPFPLVLYWLWTGRDRVRLRLREAGRWRPAIRCWARRSTAWC